VFYFFVKKAVVMTSKSFIGTTMFTFFVFMLVAMIVICPVYAQGQDGSPSAISDNLRIGVDTSVRQGAEDIVRMRPLSLKEKENGLKAMLSHCVHAAAQSLGVDGGFKNNPEAYIDLPTSFDHVVSFLYEADEKKLVDDFLFSMNRSAELSIPKVAGFFLMAVGQLRKNDVRAVSDNDNNSAATLRLHHRMSRGLVGVVRPAISEIIARGEVGEIYEKMMKPYYDSSSGGGMSFDVENHLIEKVLEEFFVSMSEEEKKLRADPSLCSREDICQYLIGEAPVEDDGTGVGLVPEGITDAN